MDDIVSIPDKLNSVCLSKNGMMLKVGDFNGDMYTDFLCHLDNGIMYVLINTKGIATI